MTQRAIPYLFLRGGTSRGPYFLRSDLPEDRDALSDVLVSVIGAGNARNIDGVGGGNAVTTKVAMLSASDDPDADVDYFFAQVAVDQPAVDYAPTCGNILVGVGPAAIEMGLVKPAGEVTPVRIRSVNTGARVQAEVQTPGGRVEYAGDCAIDGVPGTAAPIGLNFLDVVGSRTGRMFPTGQRRESIDGIAVSLVDVAMPMMIARAADLGITGYESQATLDADRALFERVEALRLEAGQRMGLGDVSQSVVPKVGLLAPAVQGGHLAVRYFMPWTCHPTLAITGSLCLTACTLAPDTIADDIAVLPQATAAESAGVPTGTLTSRLQFEHPMGLMAVNVRYRSGQGAPEEGGFEFVSAGVTRTARLIARGELLVPAGVGE